MASVTRNVQRQRRALDLDIRIGINIRVRRMMLGLTHQQLAELTGITYQQLSKYEKGIHRVYADVILRLAHILAVDVSFFFEGIEAEHVDSSTAYQNRLLTEMVRNFVGMDLQRQEAFCKVVEALVDHVEAE